MQEESWYVATKGSYENKINFHWILFWEKKCSQGGEIKKIKEEREGVNSLKKFFAIFKKILCLYQNKILDQLMMLSIGLCRVLLGPFWRHMRAKKLRIFPIPDEKKWEKLQCSHCSWAYSLKKRASQYPCLRRLGYSFQQQLPIGDVGFAYRGEENFGNSARFQSN